MDVIFEVDKNDTETIELLKEANCKIDDSEFSKGLNGTEIVALVAALTPLLKAIIERVWSKPTVTIKLSNESGTIELAANGIKELSEIIDKYLEPLSKAINTPKEVDKKNGKKNNK